MKQYITVEQADELSLKEKKVLIKWLKKHKYYNFYATSEGRLLSIGQMIEFLEDNAQGKPGWAKGFVDQWADYDVPLCDALWEAVKEVLET